MKHTGTANHHFLSLVSSCLYLENCQSQILLTSIKYSNTERKIIVKLIIV